MGDNEQEDDGIFYCPICLSGTNDNIISLCRNGHYCCKNCYDMMIENNTLNLCNMCRQPLSIRVVRTQLTTTAHALPERYRGMLVDAKKILEQTGPRIQEFKKQRKAHLQEISSLLNTRDYLKFFQSSRYGFLEPVHGVMYYPVKNLIPAKKVNKKTCSIQKKISKQITYSKSLQQKIDYYHENFPDVLEGVNRITSLEKRISLYTTKIHDMKFSISELGKTVSQLESSIFFLKSEQDELEVRLSHLRLINKTEEVISRRISFLQELESTIEKSQSKKETLIEENMDLIMEKIKLGEEIGKMKKELRSTIGSVKRWKSKKK